MWTPQVLPKVVRQIQMCQDIQAQIALQSLVLFRYHS
jgi:hypothetical protein